MDVIDPRPCHIKVGGSVELSPFFVMQPSVMVSVLVLLSLSLSLALMECTHNELKSKSSKGNNFTAPDAVRLDFPGADKVLPDSHRLPPTSTAPLAVISSAESTILDPQHAQTAALVATDSSKQLVDPGCTCQCFLCFHHRTLLEAEYPKTRGGSLFGFSWGDLEDPERGDRFMGPRVVVLLTGLLALSFVLVACVYMIAVSLAV